MAASSEREIAETLRLRAPPAPVTRLSRKVLIGLSALGALGVAAAVGYGMTTRRAPTKAAELYGVSAPPPERLNALPRDYAGVRKLGPPLPGDLGRPILAAQGGAGVTARPSPASSQVDEEARRLQQQQDEALAAARRSRLFFAEIRESAVGGGESLPRAEASPAAKRSILEAPVDRRTTSPDRLAAPPSPFVVQAGTVIPAALLTGLRADLPGQVTAQVTQNVYDTPTGRFLLIPQGARLIGTYENRLAMGQTRILVAWTRLILPGGTSLVLENLPAGDAQGYAGLQDRVDRHWRELAGMAALSTLLGVGAEVGADADENAILRALRRGATGAFNQTGQQAVGRGLDLAPTLTVRPGAPVRVLVTRDLILQPIRQ